MEVVKSARLVLGQWKKAQTHRYDSLLGINDLTEASEHWIKPEVNKTKVNIDATIFQQEGYFGFGGVARDHDGRVVDVLAGCKAWRVDVEMAEVIGIREVLTWIKDKQWSGVWVESDCLVAVQAIKGSCKMLSTFGLIVEDCRFLLSELPNVYLGYVKRSANSAAHCIARASYYLPGRSLDVHDLPPAFASIVQGDLN